MQTLLHALFDVHPLVKFSPFYNFSDLFTSENGSPSNPSNTMDDLVTSPSDFRRPNNNTYDDMASNDMDYQFRESVTLAGAENLMTNQKHNPTSYYMSQHAISQDVLPAVPQIPFPRPPLPSPDTDIRASLHPSLEMVKLVFSLCLQHLPSQQQLFFTPAQQQQQQQQHPQSSLLNSTVPVPPPTPATIPLTPAQHLLALRDEEGCTPLLKYINYRQILGRLQHVDCEEICTILIFLVQQGANVNDVQLPLRLIYTLLPQIPSSRPTEPVNLSTPHHQKGIVFDFKQQFPTSSGSNVPFSGRSTSPRAYNGPKSGQFEQFDANSGTKLPGRNIVIENSVDSDESDSDGGFMIQVTGGGGDSDEVGNYDKPRHNTSSPEHPVLMLPQQYVLTKQVHLMSIHYILSIPYTANTPVISTALSFGLGKLDEVDESFLELLLLLGADPNHVSLSNDTALRIACRHIATRKLAIPVLLNYRACARYDGTYKITNSPLYLCLQSNCELPIIRALIHRGAQVNKVVNSEPGPLFHAVNVHLQQAKRLGEKDPNVINFLIQAKANINEVDDECETVLMKAVRSKGSKLLVQSLINGSNLLFVNQQGKAAVDLALGEYAAMLG